MSSLNTLRLQTTSDMVLAKKIKNLSLPFLVENQFAIVSGAHSSVIELGFVTELKADLKE